jgi:hypothetical protein
MDQAKLISGDNHVDLTYCAAGLRLQRLPLTA